MTAPFAQSLKTIKAFKGLSSKALAEIAQHCTQSEYLPEQTVIAYGEQSTTVFFLLTGTVRATMFTQQGREISYQDLGPGDMFGELAAIDRLPRSTSVITRETAIILHIPGDYFLQMMASYPAIGQATLQKMAGVVRFLCDRVYNFGALDVRGRVRVELCRLAESRGVACHDQPQALEISDMPKQQELANRMATHREAVSRELSALEKCGLIKKKGKGTLLILDLPALQASVDQL